MLDKNLTFGGVFFMSKYSNEFKLEVVDYISLTDLVKFKNYNIKKYCSKYI